jgi:hypothetical protein
MVHLIDGVIAAGYVDTDLHEAIRDDAEIRPTRR